MAAAPVQIHNVRTWPAPDHTRIVFDIDGAVEHSLFVLKNPDRVVVDLRNTRLATEIAKPDRGDKLLRRIRSARRGGRDLRVVLDVKGGVRPRSFHLKPNKQYGHRLVIDLYGEQVAAAGKAPPTRARTAPGGEQPRDVVVVIDPGHGGEDPGATGPGRTREKTVVMSISRKLAEIVDRQPGMRARLTRTGDYYIGLRKRMDIARRYGADLFVSIHADAFRDRRVHGSSVYILSRRGASSEAARWLAEQENSADLVGGVSLDDKDELLASVLLDLSQTATLSASSEFGTKVLGELRHVGQTHKRHVERAGFVVLKSPDIPSILVETGFISNRQDERRLRDPGHQRALAQAIFNGIQHYFERNAPPGTLLAARKYVIARGDTLSAIALRYGISVSRLRSANQLTGTRIKVGQVLTIPGPAGG